MPRVLTLLALPPPVLPGSSVPTNLPHAAPPPPPSSLQLVGSVVGGRRDMVECLEFAAAKQILPMCETMPLLQVGCRWGPHST